MHHLNQLKYYTAKSLNFFNSLHCEWFSLASRSIGACSSSSSSPIRRYTLCCERHASWKRRCQKGSIFPLNALPGLSSNLYLRAEYPDNLELTWISTVFHIRVGYFCFSTTLLLNALSDFLSDRGTLFGQWVCFGCSWNRHVSHWLHLEFYNSVCLCTTAMVIDLESNLIKPGKWLLLPGI